MTTVTAAFNAVFAGADIRIIRTPVRAPRANAITERFIGTLRRECLDHLLLTGPHHLDVVLREYVRISTRTGLTDHCISTRPRARHSPTFRGDRPAAPTRPIGAASSVSTSRSRDMTGFSAPTRFGGLIREYQQVA